PPNVSSGSSEESVPTPPGGGAEDDKGEAPSEHKTSPDATSGPPQDAPPPSREGGDGEEGNEGKGPSNKHWYVVKVQSGREESIKEAIERSVKIEGLDEYFGQSIMPLARVTM